MQPTDRHIQGQSPCVTQTMVHATSNPLATKPAQPPVAETSEFWEITRIGLIALASLVVALLVGAAAMSVALLPIIAAKLGIYGVIFFGVVGTGGTGVVCYYLFHSSRSTRPTAIQPTSSGFLPITVNRVPTDKAGQVPAHLIYADDKTGNARRLTPRELVASLTKATAAILSTCSNAEQTLDTSLQDRIRRRSLSQNGIPMMALQISIPPYPGRSPQTTLEKPLTPPSDSAKPLTPDSAPAAVDAAALSKEQASSDNTAALPVPAHAEPAPLTDNRVVKLDVVPTATAAAAAATETTATVPPQLTSDKAAAALAVAMSVLPSVAAAAEAQPHPLHPDQVQFHKPADEEAGPKPVPRAGLSLTAAERMRNKQSLRATLRQSIASVANRRHTSVTATPAPANPGLEQLENTLVQGIYKAVSESSEDLGFGFITPLLQQLLSSGSKPGCLDASKVYKIIEQAAGKENFDDVVVPMLKLIDVNAADDKGETILFKVLKAEKLDENTRPKLVQCLFERGANVNQRNKFNEAIVHAAMTADAFDPAVMAIIVAQKGIDLNQPFPRGKNCLKTPNGHQQWRIIPKGTYPLHEVIRLKKRGLVGIDLVQKMVAAGADVNAIEAVANDKSPIKFSPLSLALHFRDKEVMDLLVNSKATVDKAVLSLAHPGNSLFAGDDSFLQTLKKAASAVAVN